MKHKPWPDIDSYSSADSAQFIRSGEEYFTELARLIESASTEIHLQFYIFDSDETGNYIAELLKKAAQRGVSVFVLIDGFGSSVDDAFIEGLEYFNIHFRKFNPPFSTKGFRLGRRLHVKVVVADRQRALIGGINIADKYRGTTEEPAWLDFAVFLEGEVCKDIGHLCENIWKRKRRAIRFHTTKSHSQFIPVNIKLNDHVRRRTGISQGYRDALRHSENSVVVVASYFLPGPRTRKLLKKAAQRGVEVSLILPGISDVPISKAATTYLYDYFLRNKVKIYEWKHSVLHGKIAIVDQRWATIGSYNLIHLSDYGSIELNAEIADAGFATRVSQELEKIILQCDKVDEETYYRKKSLPTQFVNWLSYQVVRFLFTLVFLFTRKGE